MGEKKKAKSGFTVSRIVLLLLFVCVAGFAYYNWPSQAEYMSDVDKPQQNDDNSTEKDSLRHRSRTASPDLSNEAYRERLLRKDKQMMARRREELRQLKKKFTLRNRRNLYQAQKDELEGLIRAHGADSAPNSITHDAAIRLKRLEQDAPY